MFECMEHSKRYNGLKDDKIKKMKKFLLKKCQNTTGKKEKNNKFIKFVGLMGRVFANCLGDWISIPGQVILKTQKMVLDADLLNTQCYKVRMKDKVSNPGKGVVPSPRPLCSSYWKGSFWFTLNYVANFTYINALLV